MIELVDAGAPLALLPRLRRALGGDAPLHPYAGTRPVLPPADHARLPRGLALVIGTSGSTGDPKLALHTADGLRASAAATAQKLGGHGQWLLALPAAHIAGVQVLVRSVLADTVPVVVDRSGGSTAGAFAAATAALGTGPAYTSLVPTQVVRLLADPDGAAALRRFTAVLVGGSALPHGLRERATANEVRLVATYGMSESAGGCVYDGRPLPGLSLALGVDARIHLGGPCVAHGYLARPEASARAFATRAPQQSAHRWDSPDPLPQDPTPAGNEPAGKHTWWFTTDDVGEVTPDGRLHVLGRVDDIISTGGLKVHPRIVEEAVLAAYPGLTAAVAVGIPDPQWGQLVALALVGGDHLNERALRDQLRGRLPAYALPRRIRHTDVLPERGPGKPDRRAIAEWMGH